VPRPVVLCVGSASVGRPGVTKLIYIPADEDVVRRLEAVQLTCKLRNLVLNCESINAGEDIKFCTVPYGPIQYCMHKKGSFSYLFTITVVLKLCVHNSFDRNSVRQSLYYQHEYGQLETTVGRDDKKYCTVSTSSTLLLNTMNHKESA
jgi:hypothetical protein